MIGYCVLLLAVAAYAQKCVHTNVNNAKADQTLVKVLKDLDKNGNGMVEDSELLSEFVNPMDKDFSLSVSRKEFVEFWPAKYGDNPEMSGELFDCLDPNNDGTLNLFDIAPLKRNVDDKINPDGKISAVEFTIYAENCYARCDFMPN